MQEFDLKDLWGRADGRADAWYEKLRPELAAIARKKNKHVLQRIRRRVQAEIIFNLFIYISLLWLLRDIHFVIFMLLAFLFLFISGNAYRYYRQFSKNIAKVPTMNIVASTESYLKIIHDYKNRLLRFSMFLIPFSLSVGFVAGFGTGTDNNYAALSEPQFWFISVLIVAITAIPTYYYTKWYHRVFLLSKEKELQAVLNGLREEEE